MPISGPSSYLPTTDLFLAHWLNANTALGAAGPLKLKGDKLRADLLALRTTLEARRTAVEDARNQQEGIRADLEISKEALLARLNQFNSKLRGIADGTRWLAMLPKAFGVSEGIGRVVPPLDDMASLWQRYENEESLITLMGGYTLVQFSADLAGLKVLYTAAGTADQALGLARGLRNETQDAIYPMLKQYRQAVPAEFPEGSAILATLPALTPPEGSRPAAVELSGAYVPATQSAQLAWTEVTDAAVTQVEVRATTGPDYDADDETVLATLPPDAPRTWTGSFGLGVPGAAATFKVFTMTAEGRERGSNPVTVLRAG